MKYYWLLLALCLPLVFTSCEESTGSAADDAAAEEAMLAGADALQKRFLEGVNSGDLDVVMDCFWQSKDLVSYPITGMRIQGIDAVRADWEDFMANMPGAQLDLTEAYTMLAGDKVITHGLWKMQVPAGDGTSQEMEGRFLDVSQEVDGKWVYILDYPSMVFTPPAPEAAEEA